jgi:ABC-type glycerol-3-phosphate transport system substrate-binding protein
MKEKLIARNRKKATRGGVLFVLAIIVLSGWWFLNQRGPSQPEQGTIDVWVTWGDNPEALREFIEPFSAERGIEINVSTKLGLDDIQESMEAGDAPDIVILSGVEPMPDFVGNGWVEPLDEGVAAGRLQIGHLLPAAVDRCTTSGGSLGCVPLGVDLLTLYWNRGLFAEAGLDPDSPPENSVELIEYARMLTRRDAEGSLVQTGFIPDIPAPHDSLYAAVFSETVTGPGRPNASSEGGAGGTIDDWQSMFDELYEPEELEDFIDTFTSYADLKHPVFSDQRMSCRGCHRTTDLQGKNIPVLGLVEGKVAMMVEGSWELWGGGALDLSAIGSAPVPGPVSGRVAVGRKAVEGPVMFIPSAAVDQQAAFELLSWLLTPEVQAEAAEVFRLIPANAGDSMSRQAVLPGAITERIPFGDGS